jgi:hypothetical protein
MGEKITNDEMIDFLLNSTEVYDGGLSHPSVESEEKQRQLADKIVEEKTIDYQCCHRFYGEERLVCDNIRKLGKWLGDRDGLNMVTVINTLLKDVCECEDLNKKYQTPLSYLYRTNKVEDIIKKTDGTYFTKKLENCCLVKNKDGEWDYVNKLNSNYNDLSELLTTLFMKGDKIDYLVKLNVTELKKYLSSLKENDTLLKLFKKYFKTEEYFDFTFNTRSNTVVGDLVEDLTKNLLEQNGYTTLYTGSNGDFIDMKYGIDIIMEKDGEIFLVQVKSRTNTAKTSIQNPTYRYIDIFAGETVDKNGIDIYRRENEFNVEFLSKDTIKNNLDYLKENFLR